MNERKTQSLPSLKHKPHTCSCRYDTAPSPLLELWPSAAKFPQGQSWGGSLGGPETHRVHKPPKTGFGSTSWIYGLRIQRQPPEQGVAWNKARKDRRPNSCKGSSPPLLKEGREGLGRNRAQLSKQVRAEFNKDQVHGNLHAEKSESPFKFTLKRHTPGSTVSSKWSEKRIIPQWLSPHETLSWQLPIRSQVTRHKDSNTGFQQVQPSGIWVWLHSSNPGSTVTSCVTIGKLLNWSVPVSHVQKHREE